ncbi:MAG: TetR/AcrR family transcriptional regulator [Alphaproteobacteria bacterium]|nr:TetR/AcrR family transcriptional regulator [Alphaproteobacteria bacterium]
MLNLHNEVCAPGPDRKQMRREAFLAHAGAVLVSLGLNRATMDDIAQSAGVSKVILYRFFSSKEKLISTLLETISDRLVSQIESPWRGVGPDIESILDIARQDSNAFILLMKHAPHDPTYGLYPEKVRDASVRRTKLLTRSIWKHLTDPRIRELSCEAVVTFLMDATLRWIERGEPKDDHIFVAWTLDTTNALYSRWESGQVTPPPGPLPLPL